MDRDRALLHLPVAYAVALRLRDSGHADATIACALGVPVEAVAGIEQIADEKLKALLDK